MKKYLMFIFMMLPFVAMAQTGETGAWYTSPEFFMAAIPFALLVIEWIMNNVPTNKKWGFILKGLIWFLKTIVDKPVKNKKKSGGFHE